jgi:hypothetical protein
MQCKIKLRLLYLFYILTAPLNIGTYLRYVLTSRKMKDIADGGIETVVTTLFNLSNDDNIKVD